MLEVLAMFSAVSPFSSTTVTSAPREIRYSAVSLWPPRALYEGGGGWERRKRRTERRERDGAERGGRRRKRDGEGEGGERRRKGRG